MVSRNNSILRRVRIFEYEHANNINGYYKKSISLLFLWLFFLSKFLFVQVSFAQKKFPTIYKVSCLNKAQGCPCYANPSNLKKTNKRLFHAEAVTSLGKQKNGFLAVQKKDSTSCYYEKKKLNKSLYAKVSFSSFQKKEHTPLPLKKFMNKSTLTLLKQKKLLQRKISMGLFWATYYHLALEDFHPSSKKNIPIRNKKGTVIGTASPSFLEQVRWQGSGITKSGLRIRVLSPSGPLHSLRFDSYPASIWGYGAGASYKVFPYRTIALHFPSLCKKLKQGPKCKKATVIGALLYIKEVAEGKISMPGNKIHDGYFCANDTGSPYYIRSDRIDIFVGAHNGGNPYLPPSRRSNALIQGGIENIVPSDWKLWKKEKQRVWCPIQKIPKNIWQPKRNECSHDYHVTARHKSLEIYAFYSPNNKLIKCKK